MIAQCVYCTEENGKLSQLKLCHESLLDTCDLENNRLLITNNSTYKPAVDYLNSISHKNIIVRQLKQNIGTAEGINLSMIQRRPKEYVTKIDDDLTWDNNGWFELMVDQIESNPNIGILGIKRDDVYGELIEDGDLLWNHDIFGTCTMYNWRMIDKVGGLVQFSEYGFDDSIFSVRSEASGFRNAFMKNLRIQNIDTKETEYTEWKKREAGLYLQEASIYMDKIKKGEISYFVEL